MASHTQLAMANALEAFSQGDVLRAESILDAATQEEQAVGGVNDILSACCMRASLAAMEGKATIDDIMAPATGTVPHPSMTCYLEGLAALARSNLPSARMKFEEALRKDQFCVFAHLGLAAVFFQRKQYKDSFSQYREVLTCLGSEVVPPIVRVGMGLNAYHLGRLDYARSVLERALEVNADDELALCGLLVVYLDCRLMPKVTETVSRLRKILPHNALVLLKVCDLLYFKAIVQERVKSALRPIQHILNEVRSLGSVEECAVADFQEGRLLLVCGDLLTAKPVLESALRTLPTLLAARIHYARLLLLLHKEEEGLPLLITINKDHPNQKEVLQLLATQAMRMGQHEAALQYCRRLTESVAQGDLRSWSLASWCTRFDTQENTRILTHVINAQKKLGQTPSWHLLANLAVLSNDTAALQALVDTHLGGNFLTKPLEVQFVPLVFNLALLLEKKNGAQSRQLYIYLVKRQSGFSLPYLRLHTMALADGQTQQAVAWLTLLQQVVPNEPMTDACLAQIFFQRKHYSTAVSTLKGSKSKSIPVAMALGAAYLWCCQQYDKDSRRFLSAAKDRFLYVLRADHGNILAAHGLACCLGLEGDSDHCQSLLDRVGEVTPNCGYVCQNHNAHMSNVKMLSERYKQAIDYLQKIENRTPQQNSSLAFCLSNENRYDEAIEVMSKASAAAPDHSMLTYNMALLCCSAFLRHVSQKTSLSKEDGRKMRGVLERGLQTAAEFLRSETKSQLRHESRNFIKSVCSYCVHVYDTLFNRLLVTGVEMDVEQQREAQRWRETFAAYRADLQKVEEQRVLEETRARVERNEAGREILEEFAQRRLSRPMNALDADLRAALYMDLGQQADAALLGMQVDGAEERTAADNITG